MKTTFKIAAVFLLFILQHACDDEDVISRDFPRVNTLQVSENTPEGVRLNASFKYRGDFEVIGYGFVWGTTENPTIEDSQQIINANNIQDDAFSEFITRDFVQGATYYVRAFVETRDFLVYGGNVSFQSEIACNAIITSITPARGCRLDTITLSGGGFSSIPENNIVYFGNNLSTVISSTRTQLRVIVPGSPSIRSASISIEVDGVTCRSSDRFHWDFDC